ncbi:hypothetical protein [Streptomyces sp. NRRL F-525]|uniref:hypothetical protein n=1 Tax=Streptomyces sp. NRRL F-525 TaxID=1463861 RepID=UPI000996D443|nr:hypothetical protein [Streptomyces sp. NRRL F-525]
MSEARASDAVNEAIAGELALLDPAVRASRSEAVRLLDPEFVEIGASGRRPSRAPSSPPAWRMFYHQGTPVPPDIE